MLDLDRTTVTTFDKLERVDRERRIIHGFSLVTRGEAAGHGLWLDDTFISQVASAVRAGGIKSRFRHPSMISDALGTVLGRVEGVAVAGAKVRGDLRVLKAADKSPEGELGSYVMELADEAPELFGASIVFSRDRAAETAFSREHEGAAGFRSPDPENTKHLCHARLGELFAVDVVDDPAANPGGLFSKERAMPEAAVNLDSKTASGAAPERHIATIEELEAAFPGRAEFILAQLKAKATLPEARQAFTVLERDEARAEAVTLREQLANKAKAKAVADGAGVDPDALGADAAPGAARFRIVEVDSPRGGIVALDNPAARAAFGGRDGLESRAVDAAINAFTRAAERRTAFDLRYDLRTSQDMEDAIRAAGALMLGKSGPVLTARLRTQFGMGLSGPDYAAIVVKGIIGRFYKSIVDEFANSWASELLWMNNESNQETETYKWLGQVPRLREWLGGRQLQAPGVNTFSITNKTWESTLPVDIEDWRFDKTGQIQLRFGELARTHLDHWEERTTDRITEDGLCYDGQNMFDTDHPAADLAEGGGTNTSTYTNEITATEVAALNASTPPTRDEIVDVVSGVIAYFRNYRDNAGRPYNDGLRTVRFMVPPALDPQFMAAVRDRLRNSGSTNTVAEGNQRYNSRLDIDVIPNSRLTGSTVGYAFRTDSAMKPFIGQEPVSPEFTFLGAGSDHAFKHNQYLGGTKAVREVDSGQWAHAIKFTLS